MLVWSSAVAALLLCFLFVCGAIPSSTALKEAHTHAHNTHVHERRPYSSYRVPLVFVFTAAPTVCAEGLPAYIHDVLQHTITFQFENEVIFAANFESCPRLLTDIQQLADITQHEHTTARSVQQQDEVQHVQPPSSSSLSSSSLSSSSSSSSVGVLSTDFSPLTVVDIDRIASSRTELFLNRSKSVFHSDGENELWLTSATRFFHLEDVMRALALPEAVHAETDNLLFGDFSHTSQTMRLLRERYTLALTPLVANLHIVTASVLFVKNTSVLAEFNDYLLELMATSPAHTVSLPEPQTADTRSEEEQEEERERAREREKNSLWSRYIRYLTRYEFSKQLKAVKPFAINEMTMLAFYRVLYPHKLQFLPVVPFYRNYFRKRYFCDLRDFQPMGRETGGGAFLSVPFYASSALSHTRAQAHSQTHTDTDTHTLTERAIEEKRLRKGHHFRHQTHHHHVYGYNKHYYYNQTESEIFHLLMRNFSAVDALSLVPSLPTESESESERETRNDTPSLSHTPSHHTALSHTHNPVSVFSVFDSGSYGQCLGGTHKHQGRDVGFLDPSHIVAQARILSQCMPEMRCMNVSRPVRSNNNNNHVFAGYIGGNSEGNSVSVSESESSTHAVEGRSVHSLRGGRAKSARGGGAEAAEACFTAPFVRCGSDTQWTPILNLHVHSKVVHRFVSQPCPCPK